MENTSDSECQLKASSRKRTSYFSDEESSTDKSNKNQSRKRYSAGIGDYNPNHHRIEQHAQPLIRAAWAGRFLVYSYVEFTCETFEGLKGCVSSRACAAVRSAAERLPATIKWKKVPRASVWPKSFERKGGPTDDDIALFFFPSVTKHETGYDSLMFDLIRKDAALTVPLMGSHTELLLFTSVDLPLLFTRFQGSLYLWGVFRGDQPCYY
ncbi:hypothetical protein SASPL_117095 [Salvia splendens]|uniref:AIPP2-like SPOC-like domain-containing protein n=1 Tax=Salvia splendens TaxID=180675 RepID=A0A8X8XXN6_SALSN|nr:hypothetical protein SASPL_117095 [Salvia splendens]